MRKPSSGGVIRSRFSAAAKNGNTSGIGWRTQTLCSSTYSFAAKKRSINEDAGVGDTLPTPASTFENSELLASTDWRHARQDDRVDHVNHAVRCLNVGIDDLGSADIHVALTKRDLNRGAVDGCHFASAHVLDVGSSDLCCDDVISENCCELFLVREQCLDRALRKLCESFIRWSKYGE